MAIYQTLRKMTNEEVLAKQGGKLRSAIYLRLRGIIPVKGSIRARLLERLRAGKFINIRPDILQKAKEKLTNKPRKRGATKLEDLGQRQDIGQGHWKQRVLMQEAVMREIGRRESGRGVLAASIRYRTADQLIVDGAKAVSRYSQIFSQVGMRADASGHYAKFEWSGMNKQSARAIKGLQAKKGAQAVNDAIDWLYKDIWVYNERKMKELAEGAVKAMIRPLRKIA